MSAAGHIHLVEAEGWGRACKGSLQRKRDERGRSTHWQSVSVLEAQRTVSLSGVWCLRSGGIHAERVRCASAVRSVMAMVCAAVQCVCANILCI